ncbi:MAG: hypothetical protein ABEI11_02660 [Haloarculaceae archaeon]
MDDQDRGDEREPDAEPGADPNPEPGADSGDDPAGEPASPYGRLTPDRVLLGGGLFVSAVGVVAVTYADPAVIPNRTALYVAVLVPTVVVVAVLAAK